MRIHSGEFHEMKFDFNILFAVYLMCLAVRTTYEAFKKAGRVDPRNKSPFIATVAAMCFLWVSWFSICPWDPQHLDLPPPIHWIGLGIFLAGWILAVGALIQLRWPNKKDHLVTTRLFARLRHPMYTGFICWIIGWSVYHGAVISFAGGIVGIANILFWRRIEDESLRSR